MLPFYRSSFSRTSTETVLVYDWLLLMVMVCLLPTESSECGGCTSMEVTNVFHSGQDLRPIRNVQTLAGDAEIMMDSCISGILN